MNDNPSKRAFKFALKAASCSLLMLSAQSQSHAKVCEPVSTSTEEMATDQRLILSPSAVELRFDLAPVIQGLIEERAIPSLTLVFFDRNDVLWAESFGFGNLATHTPANLETVYNTGSTFKFVVVTAIMQLVERGDISLDAPVNQYLLGKIDDFSPEGHPLTLRAMLAHRAGLPASRPVADADIWSRRLPTPDAELLKDIKAIERPGRIYDYCNVCFPIYAEIIRSVTGRSVEQYIREQMLVPAGVRYTEPFYPSARAAERIAVPYTVIGRTPWPIGHKFLQWPHSGDAYMRPVDMARLLQPFLGNGGVGDRRLLQRETIRSMLPPQYEDGQMSLGFLSQLEDGVRVLSWDGGIYGGSTVYQIEPENEYGVYIATNADQTTDILRQLAKLIRNLASERESVQPIIGKLEGRDPVYLPGDRLDELVGRYRINGSDAEITVHRLGDQLALINPEGKRLELVMTNDLEGTLVASRERVAFVRHGDGPSVSLTLSGDGYEFDATRQVVDSQ